MRLKGLTEQTRNYLIVVAGFFILIFCEQVVAQDVPSQHIQVLSASCAACHGTNGNSVGGTPVLAGLDRSHFIAQMMAFRTGERGSTVMFRHAKGLTPEEIIGLADFFAMQAREASKLPPASHLEEQ